MRFNALAISFFLLFSGSAYSNDLNTALSGLTSAYSTSGPGNFNNGVRNVSSFGSVNARFPVTTVNLLTITPPSFSAGCAGIDAHFGAFSYIDLDKMKDLITNILQNAQGPLIQLGIRVFCPICADVLAAFEKLAQAAAALAIDSCAAAEWLVGQLEPTESSQESGKNNACRNITSTLGEETDFMSAMSGKCRLTKAANSLVSAINNIGSPSEKEQAKRKLAEQNAAGNAMFIQLVDLGMTDMKKINLILSMVGHNFKSLKASNNPEELDKVTSTPWMNDNQGGIPEILMYGYKGFDACMSGLPVTYQNNEFLRASFDAAFKKAEGKSFARCVNSDGAVTTTTSSATAPSDCDSIIVNGLGFTSESNLPFTGCGIMVDVIKTLNQGVESARNRQALSADAIRMIQATSLPLYKIINIASVYPSMATDLVTTYAPMIAAEFAKSYITSALFAFDKIPDGKGKVGGNTRVLSDLKDLMLDTEQTIDISLKTIQTGYESKQTFFKQIDMVEKSIMQEAVGNSMLLESSVYGTVLGTKAGQQSVTNRRP